jgi:hypothetical protein
MAKIQIGKSSAPRSIKDQILEAGVEMSRNEDGAVVLSVKFPGVDSLEFTRDSLGTVVETLDRAPINGDDPGAVFARSATEGPDGGMTGKFSDAKRSRSVSFTREDRADVAILLESFMDKWSDYEAQLSEAESRANQTDGE